MIDEKELERVCRLAGLLKVTTAKIPTWRTFEGKAGIELVKDGKLKAFWFVDGERSYDGVMDDPKICSVLGAFEKETSAYKDIIEGEKKVGEELKEKNVGIVEGIPAMRFDKEAHESNMKFLEKIMDEENSKIIHHHVAYQEIHGKDVVCHVDRATHRQIHEEMVYDIMPSVIVAAKERLRKNHDSIEHIATIPREGAVLIPDVLTLPLLEKWKRMSTFERMLMFQKTDPSNVEERKGYKKPDGSYEMLKYVKGNFMLQEANIAFLFAWSSKIDNISIGQTAVAVYGSISVEIDGKLITRACVGVDEINAKVTAQHAIKNAATDMVKKGLASLGFNGDVYRGEV